MVVWCLKVYIYRCRYNNLGWFGIWDFGRDEVVGSIGFLWNLCFCRVVMVFGFGCVWGGFVFGEEWVEDIWFIPS